MLQVKNPSPLEGCYRKKVTLTIYEIHRNTALHIFIFIHICITYAFNVLIS